MSNIPLHVLDEYAKQISYKQAKRLYESKLNKKYKKTIYKGTEYQNKNSFSIYLDNSVLNEANISTNTALARYAAKYNLQYNCVNEGLYFYTPLAENYMQLINHLVADGINKDALANNADKSISSYIKKLNG